MRQRVVLWGTDENGDKVLIASGLMPRENKVETTIFPGGQVTEEFVNTLMNTWREGQEIAFPDFGTTTTKELTVTESFLPEGIVADDEDIMKRAQTEWNFVVMSVKLSDVYYKELDELKEKVENLQKFDNKVWEEMKSFWGKVQQQVREKNLIREHSGKIRKKTNQLFDHLKELRRKLDDEFKEASEENKQKFEELLADVEERIDKGLGLQPIFEELKGLQQKLRKVKLTREHRNAIWNRIDKAFKTVKAKRFGDRPKGQTPLARLQRRYDGLINAIGKMERSIKRDEKDLEFQDKRIEDSMGQLELEMRKAKIKMIEERVRSKRNKLEDMERTKVELESKTQREKQREADLQKKEEFKKEKERIKKEKEAEIKATHEGLDEKEKQKIKEAAEAIKGGKDKSKPDAGKDEPKAKAKEKTEPEESLLDAISATLGRSLLDVVDTIRAVADVSTRVVEERVEKAFQEEEE